MSFSIVEIPITPSANTTYTVTLDGTQYDLTIKYLYRLTNVANGKNIAADEFIIYIGPSGKDPVMQASLKTNRDILAPYHYLDGVPSGELKLRDKLADKAYMDGYDFSPERVTYDDLGGRFLLLYTSTE